MPCRLIIKLKSMIRISTFIILLSINSLVLSAYESRTALEMGKLSEVAYESQTSIDSWKCVVCQNIKIVNQKSFFSSTADIQGFAGYLPDLSAILLSFRGSVDTKNWIANLETTSTTYPGCSGCHVHFGFNKAYKGVSPLVHQAIQNLQALHRNAPIIITGHSLGGAMAILSALDLIQLKASVKFVYTFGQPRVGDSAFSNFYQSKIPSTYRVINYADIVPHLPPASFGFVHGGRQIWYSPRGMQSYVQCDPESSKCSNSLGISYSTSDHSLSNYLKMKTNLEEGVIVSEQSHPQMFIHSVQAQQELRKVQQVISKLIEEEENEQKMNKKNILNRFLRSK